MEITQEALFSIHIRRWSPAFGADAFRAAHDLNVTSGRMRAFVLFALLLFAHTAESAEHPHMHLVHPKGTDLVLTDLDRSTDLHATFAGHAWVSGTVVGHWPEGATNMNYKEPEFVLVPDPESVATLPYFFLRKPPYFNRYKVRSIELLNGPGALRIAAGDERVRKLLERRVNHVRVSGHFLIEQYVVGVECDAPWAKGVLTKAEFPRRVAQYNAVPSGC